MLVLGMQSGTSLDGIDAALVRFDDAGGVELVAATCTPYPERVADTVRAALLAPEAMGLRAFGELHAELGDLFADAARATVAEAGLAQTDIAAIGLHGQTIQHAPESKRPWTLQAADPARVAERTGIRVVGHLRTRDMAAGGQGAPLAPAVHAALLRAPGEHRVVLNLGGVANVTLLPPGHGPVTGFDTGPANSLSDAWIREARGLPFDEGGAWARAGNVDEAALERLLSHPYFAAPPPKSTGPETFNLAWVLATVAGLELAPEDLQATLVELTARTVGAAIERHASSCERLLVCGGGVQNDFLMDRIAMALACPVVSTATCGLDPAWVEAILFAWIARQTLLDQPGNLPGVTGAAGPRVLGAIYPP